MTYLQFHFVFTLPVIGLLWLLQSRPMGGVGARRAWRAIGLVVLIAFVYTTPWDNYLVYRGVWGYGGEDRVIGTIGYVPIEEYLFFILQTVLTGLWLMIVRRYHPPVAQESPTGWRTSLVGFWLTVAAAGMVMLFFTRSLYMGLILAWAAPVLAGMSWLGANRFWRQRRALALGIAVPTGYLWMTDAIAIALGIWEISPTYTFGLNPGGLPVEEATFFLVTNVLVVKGVTLFLPERVSVLQ
jgi:lycopene beta-cyclase